ncbi:MAG: hypothetical protein OHK0023_09370 [Anaerolineae bacterium]
MSDELTRVREYQQAVLAYEALDKQIDELLQSAGGHTEDLPDEDFLRYRELATRRDFAHNRMMELARALLDETEES